MSPIVPWAVAAALYAAFLVWYGGWKGPLTPQEVEHYMGMMQRGPMPPEERAARRRFLEQDDGRDFVMVNVIELREKPEAVGDVEPGESSERTLGRYMAYMWPALLKRACHPLFMGRAAGPAMDVWGIDAAERWSTAGMMRYRSRRDMLEIATNPAFGPSHQYKFAAMNKTIAFPVAPWQILGGARVVLGLLLFSLASLVHLVFVR